MNTPRTPTPDLDPAATPRLRSARTRGRVAGIVIGASALAAATLGAGAIAGAQDTGSNDPADTAAPAPQSIDGVDGGGWADIDPAAFAEFEAFDRCVADESGFEIDVPAAGDPSGIEVAEITDAEFAELLAEGAAGPTVVEGLDVSGVGELTDAELEELLADGVPIEIADDAELAEMLDALETAYEECAPLLPEGAGVAMLGADGTVVEFGEIPAPEMGAES